MRYKESYPGEHREVILNAGKRVSLMRAIAEYSSRIAQAPQSRLRIPNVGNRFTPVGGMHQKNPEFGKQLLQWKVSKLFPYLLELGFTKAEISEGYKMYKKWIS
jgi:hypothetical protein